MNKLAKMFKENISRYTNALITIGIIIVLQLLTGGMILRPMI